MISIQVSLRPQSPVAVHPLLPEQKLTTSAQAITTEQVIANFLASNEHQGKFGSIRSIYMNDGTRVAFVGTGNIDKLNLQKLRSLASKTAQKLNKNNIETADVYLTELEVAGVNLADKVQAIAEGIWLGLYTFDNYQTKEKDKQTKLSSINIVIHGDESKAKQALAAAKAIAAGTIFARNLGNHPGNVCTPEYLGEQASSLAHPKLKTTVMDKAAIEKAGFTALLAVNQGSNKEPRFIIMEYRGADNDDAPIALVGKGLTFDAGGISIKPASQMDEMKFDMCGSAAVLGIFKAVIEMNLPINLLGVIPSTENLLGGAAYKPGDIITTYKGLTIEILNTDAEGRVILSDALAYAAEQKPAEIIDFATLTGACVVALGGQATGLMGTSDAIKQSLITSGQKTHDRVWEMPMFEEYQEQIDSKIADIKNTGGREAGTITAACFLSRFVDDIPWAHLDIAGTAWNMKGTDISPVGGATGAGVRLIVDYLQQKVQ
ncbi:leucyl aminopeptidase [Ghiorsea bivora]|uniref:leucyl aminopeptidase n=1 Tax=Ghiorsea bivora TaxID=1485545 RepID=UPI00056EDD3C|nr:leucyl aminopeptidase [Ghiorsea bivora]